MYSSGQSINFIWYSYFFNIYLWVWFYRVLYYFSCSKCYSYSRPVKEFCNFFSLFSAICENILFCSLLLCVCLCCVCILRLRFYCIHCYAMCLIIISSFSFASLLLSMCPLCSLGNSHFIFYVMGGRSRTVL